MASMEMEIVMDLLILYNGEKQKYIHSVNQFGLMKRIAGENVC